MNRFARVGTCVMKVLPRRILPEYQELLDDLKQALEDDTRVDNVTVTKQENYLGNSEEDVPGPSQVESRVAQDRLRCLPRP